MSLGGMIPSGGEAVVFHYENLIVGGHLTHPGEGHFWTEWLTQKTTASYQEELAGVVGFEPTVRGTKNRCLTTWLHPNRAGVLTPLCGRDQDPESENFSTLPVRLS